MGYNYALFALGPYGQYWRQVRKMVMLEFLSHRRIEMMAHIQVSEIKSSLKTIYDNCLRKENGSDNVKVEMMEYFEHLTLNTTVRMLVGKSYLAEEEDMVRVQKALKKLVDLLGTLMVSDAIPYLRWLDLGGYQKIMRKTWKDMDDILEAWLKEHRERRDLGLVKGEQHDFMDAMLAHVDGAADDDFPGFDADTVNKAVCLTLLSGATETVTVILTWALSLLLTHPNTMKKLQDELDIHVDKNRQVDESDLAHLAYLKAVIKETLRLYPAAPVGVPHEAMEDCIVGGYNIPKGTRLFVNIWKIHHDPEAWPDPYEFRPERFLTSHKDVDVRGQHFDLIPFGSGRRMCPGMSFGLQAVQLTIASLVHGFDFNTPSNEPIDMSVLPGLTNVKATPLELLLSPRLPAQVYGSIIL